MGTKVERLLSGYHHSMRDLNHDSNGCRLPLFNSDKTSAHDQSYKDVVRRTMLEHEAVFKSQVLELHRVYGIQKDMMDELKRKQFNKEWCPIEASCSSQATTHDDDVRKWKMPSFPSMSVVEDNGHSPIKGTTSSQVPWINGASSNKHVEALEVVRPTKIRRKMIDLCLPADEYIDDNDDVIELKDHRRVCSNGLADLNEPFKAQETNEVAYGQSHERPQHQPLRVDHYNGTYKSPTPFLQQGKLLDSSSQQRVMSIPPSKAEMWRGKTFIDLEADTDTNTSSHEVIHESSFASHQPHHLYHPYNPPESALPWNRPWQNPTSFGFSQRVASAQRYPVLNVSDTNAQKLQFESNGRYNNSGCGSNNIRANHNMFYNECSSSKSKLKFSGNAFLDLNGSEVRKSVRDLNLNVTLSNTSVDEVRKDEEHLATLPWLVKPKPACISDGRWNLKSNDAVPKPSNIKEEGGNSVQNLMWLERLKSGSCSSKPETEKIDESNAERDKVRIMLDINEPCEPVSDEEEQQMEKQTKFHIDLNMSVSEDEVESWSVPPTSSRLSSKRPMIDLETVPESDVEEEEEEDLSGEKPSEETLTEEKTLEKPPEFEETAAEAIVAISSACLDKEVEDAVVAPPETVILHWFAETVDTHRENLDQKLASFSRNQARSIEEIDYFESMTLQLPEITEEEYIPKPLVPEDIVLEETSVATSHQRPRRGNARKGKQKRDFQRDILPGLLSLSKHEVTEDIQMFDGFMRATGRSWTRTGLTRKKTGARGRPRRVITIPEPVVYYPVQAPCPSVQQQQQHVGNNGEIEMGFEDGSFGGWGKMTRRPRRQRCPSNVTSTSITNVQHHTRMSRDGWE